MAGAVRPLAHLAVGRTARVTQVAARGGLRQRLLEMGLTIGQEVVVEGVAPLGDPLRVRVRGYSLTLRKNEAEAVLVEEDGNGGPSADPPERRTGGSR